MKLDNVFAKIPFDNAIEENSNPNFQEALREARWDLFVSLLILSMSDDSNKSLAKNYVTTIKKLLFAYPNADEHKFSARIRLESDLQLMKDAAQEFFESSHIDGCIKSFPIWM